MRTKRITIAIIVLSMIAIIGFITYTYRLENEKNGLPSFANKEVSTSIPSPSSSPTSTPTSTATTPSIDSDNDPRFTNTDSLLVFANKKHKLPDGYEPEDLVLISNNYATGEAYMKKEAAQALEEMLEAAYGDGVYPIVVSAYRSASYQKTLYNSYVNRDGQEAADTYSSRSGYSDHQTGLTVDISSSSNGYHLNQSFENTEEGKWLAENAYKYGFVMRYPKGKQDITGYMYEPWHFRYIGVEEATALYSAAPDMTMEEFYGVTGGDYEN